MDRRILHLDLDAFFCAVEELLDPTLAGTAFAVGGRPESRGVVTSCSYPARHRGVRSAMPMMLAVRICPDLKIVTPEHRLYSEKSRQVMEILKNTTGLMEQISIDEAFLDISEMDELDESIAHQLQKKIQQELGLPCSIGIASNKLVAKIATNYGKSLARGEKPPNAITIVPKGQEKEFLEPLPVEALWGVGPKTAERLTRLGIHTIGDVSRISQQELIHSFGKHGYELWLRAQGIDDRPLISYYEPKSVSQETTFEKDIKDHEILISTLKRLSSRVSKHLIKAGKRGVTIKVKIRWPDFTTLTRQITLPEPTDQEDAIFRAAQDLFDKEWKKGQAVRLLGVGVSGFEKVVYQMGLWDSRMPVENIPDSLQEALETLRKRFGDHVVGKGSEILQSSSSKKREI